MSDLMHIVDKLREAAMQAKRECDTQVEQVLTRMTKKIKDDITSHRDKLLQQRKTLVEQEEKEHVTQKQQVSGQRQKAHYAQLDANIKEFERLKRSLIELLETHKVKQKRLATGSTKIKERKIMPQEFDERITQLQAKHSRMKAKQDKLAAAALADLCNKLNKKLVQKMNHCKCLMLRDDETLVKVHHMLTGNDS